MTTSWNRVFGLVALIAILSMVLLAGCASPDAADQPLATDPERILAAVLAAPVWSVASDSADVTDCDRVASYPYDPDGLAPGTPSTILDTEKAVSVCGQALAEHPKHPRYQFLYGRALFNAGRLEEATPFYVEAASQGYGAAIVEIGIAFELGEGVPTTYETAAALFRNAAERGNALGEVHLGRAYEAGTGVPQDDAKAVAFYAQAAGRGHAGGQNSLGHAYYNGIGVRQDLAEAVRLFRLAAEQGHATAQANLGWCYEHGEGVPQDREEAVVWYRKAAAQGNETAIEELSRLGMS